MRIANATNGLAFPPYDAVSMFLSTHGHSYKSGYFRIDAMPYNAVIELLKGSTITIVDATQHDKELPDSFKFGLTTWVLVFNRAIGFRQSKVAPWQTKEMLKISSGSIHKPLVQRIRRLIEIYGKPDRLITIGHQVKIEVYRNFKLDDNPVLIRQEIIERKSLNV